MKKIFIVGCPRSGTTLVHKLFGAHTDTYVCKETFYFLKIRRGGKRKLLDHLFLSNRNVLGAFDFIRTHNQLLEQHDPNGKRSLGSATLFFDQLMTREAQVRKKLAWVEKTPRHMFHIRLITRYIPAAQFVHVIRDGRDVVASLTDAAEKFPQVWKRHSNLETAISVYNLFLKESSKYHTNEGHVFVQYERILDDVEGTSHKLFAALGLESQGLPDWGAIHQQVVRGDEGWKNDSRAEIRDTRLVKFKQIFDEKQQRFIISNIKELPEGVVSWLR